MNNTQKPVPIDTVKVQQIANKIDKANNTKTNNYTFADNIKNEAIQRILKDNPKAKQNGNIINYITCSKCGKPEAYINFDKGFCILCHRSNNCGAKVNVKELYPDLYQDSCKRFQVAPTDKRVSNPAYYGKQKPIITDNDKKSVKEYFKKKRGLNPDNFEYEVKYEYSLKNNDNRLCAVFEHQKIIQFIFLDGEKLFKKNHGPGGNVWKHSTFTTDKNIYSTESIIDALSLIHWGYNAVCSFSAVNTPKDFYSTLQKESHIVLAFDNDAAGKKGIEKNFNYLRDNGITSVSAALPVFGQKDWNDILIQTSQNLKDPDEMLYCHTAGDKLLDNNFWDTPLPLTNVHHVVTECPTNHLPNSLKDMINSIVGTMNIAEPMAFATVLGVHSIAMGKRYKIQIKPDHIQFGNLYIQIILDVAGGKTVVIKAVQDAILDKQKEYAETYKEQIRHYYAKKKVIDAQIKKAENKPLKLEFENDRIQEIIRLQEELGEKPVEHSIICSDVTSEALEVELCDNYEQIGIMSGEGRKVHKNNKGRYNNGTSDCGVWLAGHGGDYIKTKRIIRSKTELFNPILSAVIALQPDALATAGESIGLRESGYLARWLSVYLNSTCSNYPVNSIPVEIKNRFNSLISSLLDKDRTTEKEITLSPEAFRIWVAYHNELYTNIKIHKDELSVLTIQSFKKLPEHIARIALNLHVAKCIESKNESSICNTETMKSAIIIGDFFREHINQAVAIMGEDMTLVNARKLWNWLDKKRDWLKALRLKNELGSIEAVKISEISQQGVAGLNNKEKVQPVIDLLCEYGWLRKIENKSPLNNKTQTIYELYTKQVKHNV